MIIISGPSTVGKNPFIYSACKKYGLNYLVPYTTRDIRVDETGGKDYYFLSKRDFQNKIRSGEINEWDYCLENYYGYKMENAVNNTITHGLSRMTLRIKSKYPDDVYTIFLMPQNIVRINNNLNNIYSGRSLLLRENLVKEEICHSVLFDKIFTCNDPVFDILENEEFKEILKKY